MFKLTISALSILLVFALCLDGVACLSLYPVQQEHHNWLFAEQPKAGSPARASQLSQIGRARHVRRDVSQALNFAGADNNNNNNNNNGAHDNGAEPIEEGAETILRGGALQSLQEATMRSEERPFAKVTISKPVQAIKMLNKLIFDISWSMFEEHYRTNNGANKDIMMKIREEIESEGAPIPNFS